MLRLFPVALLLVCGCGREDPIHQYAVDKPRGATGSSSGGVVEGSQAWFFKLSGPADAVGQRIIPFAELIRSVSLRGGEPQFEVPQGWERRPGNAMRFATLAINDADPPLEVAISSLPYSSELGDQYVLANLNRWRGQMGMGTLEGANWRAEAEARSELLEFPSREGRILLIHLAGETQEFGDTRMLAAMLLPEGAPADSSMTPPAMSDTPVQTAPAPFDYKLPEGWETSPGSSVRLASFKATSDAGTVDIAVTRFPGGGGLLDNINRWRGQVKLDAISEAELEASMTPIEVGGIAAQLAEIVGPEQTILVATIPQGDSKWFFKAQGPVEAVAAQRAAFLALLESVTFQADAGK